VPTTPDEGGSQNHRAPLITPLPPLARSRRNRRARRNRSSRRQGFTLKAPKNRIKRRRRGRFPPGERASAEIPRRHLDRADGGAGMSISRVAILSSRRSRGSSPGPPWWDSSSRPCDSGKAASRARANEAGQGKPRGPRFFVWRQRNAGASPTPLDGACKARNPHEQWRMDPTRRSRQRAIRRHAIPKQRPRDTLA
jgi:hypothetical protein